MWELALELALLESVVAVKGLSGLDAIASVRLKLVPRGLRYRKSVAEGWH